ncbi:hypothetical protein [Blastopirellula marina]|nr:hypothetical protein [Blastopirellula marina]
MAKRNSIGRNWKHRPGLETLEVREMLDASGELISLRLAVTDLHGNQIEQIAQGEAFLVKAYIEDRRGEPGVVVDVPEPDPQNPNNTPDISDDPYGFFTAYFNVTYDAAGFDFDESYGIQIGPTISEVSVPVPDTSIDGYIERLGMQNIDTSGLFHPNEVELLSFRMIAQQPGNYDLAEGFMPHFHFDVVDYIEDVNELPENWDVNYVNGVPQLERLTGSEFMDATVGADEYFSLYHYGTERLTQDSQVYFEGVGLQVLAPTTTEYQVRYVDEPTTTLGGEVNALPSNLEYFDEWSYFYVEVYAKAPNGNSLNAGVVTVNYDPDDFEFVQAVGRNEDPTSLRYSITFTEVDNENGSVTVGYNTLATDLGDDRFALLGRIQLRSKIEMPVDYTNGELQPTTSSDVMLGDASATIYNDISDSRSVVGGTTSAGTNFEVWPVIYDVANGEDRQVGLADFSDFVAVFGKSVNNDPEIRKLDFDNNGTIGLSDFSLFVQNFGQSNYYDSKRIYPAGYPGDLSSPALMGSSSLLEGEPVASPSTSRREAPVVAAGPPQPVSSDNVSSNLLSLPATNSVSTNSPAQSSTEEGSSAASSEETIDAFVSQWNDQSDLIALTAVVRSDETSSDDENADFVANTDEILAIWEDEEQL